MMELNDLPNEILVKLFVFIHLTQRLGSVALVCKRWLYLCSTSILNQLPFTLVISQRNTKTVNVIRAESDFLKFSGLYSAFNIPLKASLNHRTFYCYFSELAELTSIVDRLPIITQLVIHSTQNNQIVGILQHMLRIFQQNYKLRSLKLIQNEMNATEMSTIWQMLTGEKREFTHLSLGTSSAVQMTNSDTVMAKLVSFNYANLGANDINVFAILSRLSDEKCRSIGIHLCDPLDTVRHTYREAGGNEAAKKIQGHILQLLELRPVLWHCITRITEMSPLLVNDLRPAIVNSLNLDSLQYLQVGLDTMGDLKDYVKFIVSCPHVTHLALNIKFRFKTNSNGNELFEFVRTIRAMRARYPKGRSQSIQHITMIVHLKNDDYFETKNFLSEVVALFPNLQTLKAVCYFQNNSFELCLMSNGKWFRDN